MRVVETGYILRSALDVGRADAARSTCSNAVLVIALGVACRTSSGWGGSHKNGSRCSSSQRIGTSWIMTRGVSRHRHTVNSTHSSDVVGTHRQVACHGSGAIDEHRPGVVGGLVQVRQGGVRSDTAAASPART